MGQYVLIGYVCTFRGISDEVKFAALTESEYLQEQSYYMGDQCVDIVVPVTSVCIN